MKYYIKEQWRAALYDGEIVFRDTLDEAAEDCAGEPDLVLGVFYGDGGEDDLLIADCYTVERAAFVRAALDLDFERKPADWRPK